MVEKDEGVFFVRLFGVFFCDRNGKANILDTVGCLLVDNIKKESITCGNLGELALFTLHIKFQDVI